MEFNTKENVITAFGDIYEGDGSIFSNILSEQEQIYPNIIIKLHTNGGSVFDGNIMYNAIINSKASISIHIVGIAASMGAILSLSIDEVYMVENGYLMIHAPSYGGYGTAKDLESSVKLLKAIENNFIKKLQQKTGKNVEYVEKWLNGDNWFSAEQALQEGLIKGIIAPEHNFRANFNPKNLPTKEVFARFENLFNNHFNYENMDFRQQLASRFNLQATTSDTKILQEVDGLKQLKNSIIDLLKLEKETSNEDILRAIQNLLDEQGNLEEERQEEAKRLTLQAIRNGQISAMQETHILGMFKKDFKGTKQFLDNAPRKSPIDIMALIKNNQNESQNNHQKPKSEWSLDDYRKNAPKELEQNPQLYKRLIKEKYNNKI